MLYYTTRMECLHCSYVFNVWFQADTPPNANAKYRVLCPMNASPWVLPISVFKPVAEPPADGVEAELVIGDSGGSPKTSPRILDTEIVPPIPPKRKRWQFWKC
jgi:hypothetical protein